MNQSLLRSIQAVDLNSTKCHFGAFVLEVGRDLMWFFDSYCSNIVV